MYSAADTLAGGFPHSEIIGSKPARGSPMLIATCYVLHRLSVPRHPPDALIALDRKTVMYGEQDAKASTHQHDTLTRRHIPMELRKRNPSQCCLRELINLTMSKNRLVERYTQRQMVSLRILCL